MQLNPLTVKDPLDEELVIINIQVNADHKTRSQRSVLVTAGISGQVPVMLAGQYGQLNELIKQAWREFGRNSSRSIPEASTTIAQVSVKAKPNQKKQTPSKESILSLF